ncbi:MAG: DUF433 domain-containing protein [Acidiferrobacterales bacterium]
MMILETTQAVPLTLAEDGTIRLTGTRVSLDSIIGQYQQGDSAERIHESFPSLKLADIYVVISYYLNHREAVDEYLQQRAAKAEAIRQQIESDPEYQARVAKMRERIQQRWQTRQSDE